MTPLLLLLYLLALAGGILIVGLVLCLLLSVNRADRYRQAREHAKIVGPGERRPIL